VVLEWETSAGDAGTGDVTVVTENDTDSQEVTIQVDDSQEEGSPDGAGGGGGAPAEVDDEQDTEELDDSEVDRTLDSDSENVERAERSSIESDEESGESVAQFSEESSVESVRFDEEVEGDATVAELAEPPEETGSPGGAVVGSFEFDVPEEAEDADATITMRISQEQVEESDADPEDLTVRRFADGEWETLETEVRGEDAETGEVILRAETPGFSFFGVSAVDAPDAAFEVAPQDIVAGVEALLDGGESENRYGEITEFEWRIDDEQLTGQEVQTAIEQAGEITIELTVVNDAGETDTAVRTVVVDEDDREGVEGTATASADDAADESETSPDGADDDASQTTATAGAADGTDDPEPIAGGYGFLLGIVGILLVIVVVAVVAVRRF
jgi:PGF-pre-PGF domain-containing protein